MLKCMTIRCQHLKCLSLPEGGFPVKVKKIVRAASLF